MTCANFFHILLMHKRPKKLVSDVLHFLCTIINQRNTVQLYNCMPSVCVRGAGNALDVL